MRAWWFLALAAIAALPATAAPLTVASDSHRFTVQVSGLQRPEPLNRMHGLDIAVATVDGKPVTGATLAITGERRYSDTPLPTMPQVAPAGTPGHYRLEGLRFHMPGEWRLVLDIEFAHSSDHATFDVVVK
jgi:hypothetical protein